MDKRIWKYELETIDAQILYLPANAKFLKILVLIGIPSLYALIDLEEEDEKVLIRTFGTGQQIHNTEKLEYIDTYSNGDFVWHVFKKEK